MTAAQNIKIYQILRKHYGATADVAAAAVEIEQIVEKWLEQKSGLQAVERRRDGACPRP